MLRLGNASALASEALFVEAAARSPASLFEVFAGRPYPFLLESATPGPRLGRYSILGADPFLVVRTRGREAEVRENGRAYSVCAHPLDLLQRLLERYPLSAGDCPVPFAGGAVGYLGYDLGRQIERLPHAPPDDLCLPETCLAFYDAGVVVDHQADAAYVISTGLPEPPGGARSERARRRLREIERQLASPPETGAPRARRSPEGRGVALANPGSNFARDDYLAAVRRIKDYIVAGDVYQVNLSQRFRAPWTESPWRLYRRLRELNAAPFAAYLDAGDFAVVSSSPERFLRVRDDYIETRPIKGTRARGATELEDARLAAELRASAKDRAEHIMIVDLERNDLGRVCEVGSVEVPEMMALESYATVHHLTSTVSGRLRRDAGVSDLLRATFPGGSITGAPKIRAMQIIDELEPTRRGVYTGAIGYFSFAGGLDLSIAIRTAIVKGGEAFVQLGGGIVHDSDPEAEYQETLDKGRALLEALTMAQAPGED